MPSARKPRILLIIPHLSGGGSERVIETLTRHLNPDKYEIHLALIAPSQNSDPIAPLTAKLHQLSALRVRNSVIPLLLLIWKLRPSLILSGIAHLNLLVLAFKPFIPRATRIMVRQNGALAETLRSHSRRLSHRAYSLAYRHADRIICQTQAMSLELQRELRVKEANLIVLPNPTDVSSIRSKHPACQKPTPSFLNLIAIGRLVPEKGFDLLLDALAALPAPLDSAYLLLVGCGPQQVQLERQAEQLGIRSRVQFLGHVPNPIALFHTASAFVLSSRTEGLPNALLEAAAAGLPIIATPASAGVVDLLRNREGVWLTPTISSGAFKLALQTALVSIRPGQRYLHTWIDPYDLPCAIASYESAIDQVLACNAT